MKLSIKKEKEKKKETHSVSELTVLLRGCSGPCYRFGRINQAFNEQNFHPALVGQCHSNQYRLGV